MSVYMLDVYELRARLREQYIVHPDDSHGQSYINSGIERAIRVVADMVGDIDYKAPCEPDADIQKTSDVWCRVHLAPMGSRWCCDFAEEPWVWHKR